MCKAVEVGMCVRILFMSLFLFCFCAHLFFLSPCSVKCLYNILYIPSIDFHKEGYKTDEVESKLDV